MGWDGTFGRESDCRSFYTDFGGSDEAVLRHLQRYAAPDIVDRLKGFHGKISYDYDWRINEP
jgi:hypothetical protein